MKSAIATIAVIANLVASVSGPNYVYTTTDLNVRRAPGLEYEIVTTLPPHSQLNFEEVVTTYGDEQWVKVMVNGVSYYVKYEYVDFNKPAEEDLVWVYQVEPGAPGVHTVTHW